jgi:two-component system, LytTR family, response regulator
MRIRTLIVDDEPLAREGIRIQLARHPDVEVVAECASGREAVRMIEEVQPDLVFLDVQMPGLDGFGLIEAVGAEQMPVVVFVTAHDAHALRAFEAHALDYVLKPIDRERFEQALTRARRRLEKDRYGAVGQRLSAALAEIGGGRAADPADVIPSPPDRQTADRFLVASGHRRRVVSAAAIDWVEAESDHVRLHVGGESYLLRLSLANLEARLDPQRFVRVHRSTIVNVDRIGELLPYSNREYIAVLHDGTRLKVSRSYRDRLDSFFGGTF